MLHTIEKKLSILLSRLKCLMTPSSCQDLMDVTVGVIRIGALCSMVLSIQNRFGLGLGDSPVHHLVGGGYCQFPIQILDM